MATHPKHLFLVYLLFAITSPTAGATDYTVVFGAPSPNPGQTVSTGGAAAFTPWRSVGLQNGVNLENTTGRQVSALHIKTRRATDRFVLSPPFDNFFLKIWKKKDGREVIFSGAAIRPTEEFFSKVSRTDDFPSKILDGKLSPTDLVPDNPEEWDQIHDGLQNQSAAWKLFLPLCPSSLRSIDVFGESKGGDVCFVSKGRLYLFSAAAKNVDRVEVLDLLPGRINRIEPNNERHQFVVYAGGVELGSLPCSAKPGEKVVLKIKE